MVTFSSLVLTLFLATPQLGVSLEFNETKIPHNETDLDDIATSTSKSLPTRYSEHFSFAKLG